MKSEDTSKTDFDRQLHALELKNEAKNLTGGQMHSSETGDIEPAVEEQFWQGVVDFEKAPVVYL